MTQQQGPGQQGTPPAQGGGVGIGLGSMGAGGIPRLKVDAGDYHPRRLWSAVASGEGFAKPRMMGLMMLALAIAFAIGNAILMLVAHIYYPYLYSLSAVIWWGGVWLLVTGHPQATTDGSKAPMWARAGLAAFLVIGVLVGIAMCFFDWETMLAARAMNAAGR
jgi:hypothetical protein